MKTCHWMIIASVVLPLVACGGDDDDDTGYNNAKGGSSGQVVGSGGDQNQAGETGDGGTTQEGGSGGTPNSGGTTAGGGGTTAGGGGSGGTPAGGGGSGGTPAGGGGSGGTPAGGGGSGGTPAGGGGSGGTPAGGGSGGTPAGGAGGEEVGGSGGVGTGGDPGACTLIAVPETGSTDDIKYYGGLVDPGIATDLADFFQLEIWAGDPAVGSVDLSDDTNYATCPYCVGVYEDVNEAGTEYTRFYLHESGTLNITTINTPHDGQLVAEVQNARLIEVTIADDYTSTPVPDGACLIVNSVSFDTPKHPDAEACQPEGDACFDCCGAAHEDGYNLFNENYSICVCETACATECGDNACAGETASDACNTCMDAAFGSGGECLSVFYDCFADEQCDMFYQCWSMCP